MEKMYGVFIKHDLNIYIYEFSMIGAIGDGAATRSRLLFNLNFIQPNKQQ